jgi:Tol biopolymer transport system component
VSGVLGMLVAACALGAVAADFSAPQRVQIAGYSSDAMEPFVSRDGRYLLFNDSNAPGRNTELHVAERIDDTTFEYLGPLVGANSPALDGVPSLDRDGRLVFVSLRSYPATLSTLYEGRFAGGAATDVRLLGGLSLGIPGWVNFDAELSADGTTLYFVDGRFDESPLPAEADLVIARRQGAELERLAGSDALLAEVNTAAALEYAPAISPDGRELFFTRLEPDGSAPRILRATRSSPHQPFGRPRRVAAAAGFVEAPALSPDGRSLYYHRLDGAVFSIYRVTRDDGGGGDGEECPSDYLTDGQYPGFCFQVTLTPAGAAPLRGSKESDCVADTVCVSGALPGRTEVFLRILGPRPNGYLWPTLTRFTPAAVEVKVLQLSTGLEKTYTLGAVPPGLDDLSGLQDREGFVP